MKTEARALMSLRLPEKYHKIKNHTENKIFCLLKFKKKRTGILS